MHAWPDVPLLPIASRAVVSSSLVSLRQKLFLLFLHVAVSVETELTNGQFRSLSAVRKLTLGLRVLDMYTD